ncbi:MAG: hypothetical protein JMN24_18635 [gamma proteobacterium endosymbiont of Lamellibrachia anaximandri]|nr:hypothetical protein [gamma proteobacterium endosymbiont of Lamellibrachia anaximandri]
MPFRIPALQKAAKVRPPKLEVKMRLITTFELAAKSKTELHALLREVFNELARSKSDTHQRRNTLASLENIQREINSRAPSP